MATSLDMSLEDMIKKSRSTSERTRGRGRGRGGRGRGPGGSFGRGRMAGAVRRGPFNVYTRPTPYTIAKSTRRVRSFPWQHALLEDSIRAAGIQGIEIGTKIYISNLDYGVTNEDIRELFAEIGDLKRYAVHYDKTGRPSGSAEVVYTRRSDAFAALKRYNNVVLDGKPMKIEIVGDSSEIPISARVNVTGVNGRRKRTVVMTKPGGGPNRISGVLNRGSAVNRGSGPRNRGGMNNVRGGARNRGRGRGKKQPVEKSADDLDKELESYHAMNTS